MEQKKPPDITIPLEPLSMVASASGPTVWISDNFAQDWFSDALHEAQSGKDHNSIRREIIYAACFAESYIFEWARSVLQIEEINDYFPPTPRFSDDPRYRRDLKKKWKEIPSELYKAGKIKVDPKLNLSGLGTLLKYRHGLVHASASRPATGSQPDKKAKPFPTKEELKKLRPGWAVGIIIKLVKDLHQALGTPVPGYVVP